MSINSLNITDPETWNKLPQGTRMSAVLQIQKVMIVRALQATYGEQLLALKQKGKNVSKTLLLIAHKNEDMVSAAQRTKMKDGKYQVTLVQLNQKARAPKGATKQFSELFKIAIKNRPESGDLWCIIASAGQSYLLEVSLDEYQKELEEQAATKAQQEEAAKLGVIASASPANDVATLEAPAGDQ